MSQKIFIRPQTRKRTDAIKEKNSYFLCPSNTVLTGRCHSGDENGMTRYQTGIVKFNGKKAKVTHYPEADLVVRESGGLEVLPKDNLVMIGIKHSGDENGLTTYCQGYIIIS